MPGLHDANGAGRSAMSILDDHQTGVDPCAQLVFKRVGHSRRRLSGTDDDDSLYSLEGVVMRADEKLVVADSNLPADGLVGIDRLQSRLKEPCEEGLGSWLRDADTHHVH